MKTGIFDTLGGVLLLVIAGLVWLAFHFHASAVTEQGKVRQLESDNTLQAQIISTQALNFNKFNQLAAASQQYGITVKASSEERVIEYREILKKQSVPTCDLAVPAGIAERLLDYTYRLRASAMSGAAGNADSAGSPAIAASQLTYCRAVLWIDPLLSTIDEANDKLAKIRAAQPPQTGGADAKAP